MVVRSFFWGMRGRVLSDLGKMVGVGVGVLFGDFSVYGF